MRYKDRRVDETTAEIAERDVGDVAVSDVGRRRVAAVLNLFYLLRRRRRRKISWSVCT